MKNWYLAFCKFATLALMVGLTMKFLSLGKIQNLVQADGDDSSTACESAAYGSVTDSGDSVSKTVSSNEVVSGVCIKSGNNSFGSLKHSDLLTANGSYGNDSCYVVTGIGTQTVTVTRVQSDDCKEISHIDVGVTEREVECEADQYEDEGECKDKTPVCTDPDATNYDSEVGDNEVSSFAVCQCVARGTCSDECGQPQTTIPDGSCGFSTCDATSACVDPSRPSMSSEVSCGQIDLTFVNPTAFFFSFDYRVDNEDGQDDAYTNMAIANGPWAGLLFGQRFNIVDVLAGQTENRTVTFTEDSGVHTVAYRLWRGAENDWYLNWVSEEVESDCDENIPGCTDELATNYDPEATQDDESCQYPQSTPTPTPTPSPVPTEPPGYNCPVAQSCPSACGQGAQDVPNGSCGFNHCDPTPSCDGGIGGGTPTGTVLGTTTKAASVSGQVLGATTYAATGVAEDIAFALIGMTGAGLSSVGILMKKNAKIQK